MTVDLLHRTQEVRKRRFLCPQVKASQRQPRRDGEQNGDYRESCRALGGAADADAVVRVTYAFDYPSQRSGGQLPADPMLLETCAIQHLKLVMDTKGKGSSSENAPRMPASRARLACFDHEAD
jgi:hypothetical protein